MSISEGQQDDFGAGCAVLIEVESPRFYGGIFHAQPHLESDGVVIDGVFN